MMSSVCPWLCQVRVARSSWVKPCKSFLWHNNLCKILPLLKQFFMFMNTQAAGTWQKSTGTSFSSLNSNRPAEGSTEDKKKSPSEQDSLLNQTNSVKHEPETPTWQRSSWLFDVRKHETRKQLPSFWKWLPSNIQYVFMQECTSETVCWERWGSAAHVESD